MKIKDRLQQHAQQKEQKTEKQANMQKITPTGSKAEANTSEEDAATAESTSRG